MKKSHLTRRDMILGASTFTGLGLVGTRTSASGATSVTTLPFPFRGKITTGLRATVTHISTAEPIVALTFDDGPHQRLTPWLLDILAAHGVKATFYVVGKAVAHSPHLIARMVTEGHEIGNHTWSHPSLLGWPDAPTLDQIDRTNRAVYDASGIIPKTFRPPYGKFYPYQRLMMMRERRMPTVLWSVDPQDWRRPGMQYITNHIVTHSIPGSIVLAHDIHAPTVGSFPATIEALVKRGFRFVTVSELTGLSV